MAKITRVLFDGSYENYGHIYELEGGEIVFYSDVGYFQAGDDLIGGYRSFSQLQFGEVSLEEIVVQQWGSQGPLFYFLNDGNFYSHAFIETNDGKVEPIGSLKSEKIDQLYDLENVYGTDFDSDGVTGRPPVTISRILFGGSGYGDLFELEGGDIILYTNEINYESGDLVYDSYKRIESNELDGIYFESVVFAEWDDNGPKLYFLTDGKLFSQKFIDRDERYGYLEANGSLVQESQERMYELEGQYGEDLNSDDEIGEPSPVIERVVFGGKNYGYGSLFELKGGEFAFYDSDQYYEEGYKLNDYHRVVEDSDFGDVSLEDVVLSDWGNNGPRFYFWNGDALYSQEFRDRNGQLETDGSLKSVEEERMYELEDQFGEDLNGDGETGKPPVVIDRVLFDGSNNGYGSVFELEGGGIVWLNNGDSYEKGDEIDDYYQTIEESDFGDVSLEDVVLSDWGNNGPRFYFWNGDALYSQEFRDRNGQLETDGSLKSVKEDRLYELEDQYGEDLNGDGETGTPPVVIEQVLFDGSNNGYGSVFELEGGEIVWLSNGDSYEKGDEIDDYYQTIEESDFGDVSLEDVVLSDWGNNGPRFYFWNGDALYSQEFRDRNGQLETDGSLKSVKEDRLYELEDQYGEDLNGDGETGTPPVVIEQVLFDGSNNGYGSVFELEGGEIVWLSNGDSYEKGDEIDDYYQTIEESDFGDVSLEDVVLSDWGNNGPRFYFWNGDALYSQEFRDRNGQLETDGSLKSVKEDRLYELEDQFGEDLNGDGETGTPPVVIQQVLFDGSNNGYGSVFELEGGEIVWLNNGDSYEKGDEIDDYYQTIEESDFGDVSLEDVVLSDWGNNGPRFYFWNGDALYSQEFRDRNGQLETDGSLKSVKEDHLYELEDQFGEDLNGDGETGTPPVVIQQVLFDGSSNGSGSLFELEGGEIVWYVNGGFYEQGENLDDYYFTINERDFGDVSLEDVVLSDWGEKGPKFYLWSGEALFSQEYSELIGRLETKGNLKSVEEERMYELEDQYGEDLNGDGETGKPPVVIDRVLFDGSNNGYGSVFELEGGESVWLNNGDSYEKGDEIDDYYQTIEESDFGDVSLDDVVLSGWGDNGPKFYFWNGGSLYSHKFRENDGVLEADGNLKNEKQKHLYELEDEYGVDIDGDDEIGEPLATISTVLFSGEEGDWDRGLYELDDATIVMSESELEEGDTPFDIRQLVTSKGDDFAVDGDVLGAYGVNRGFAVLYEDGAKIMRQNFRESGDVARTNGKPKSLSSKQVAELEEEHGVDFNGDGVYGEESAEISSVLFAGDEGTWGRGLYELDDATIVMSESELEEGDTPFDIRQLVTSKGDDFAVDGDVLGAYGVNRGFAVLYEDGAKIMRQNFRESGDVARTNGKPESLSSKQVAELEEEHGVDFNGDGVYGEESAEISSVLFAGDEGTWGRGLYELDDATFVASEAELEEGDTPSEAYQLVTSKGDDFAVDGDVLGAYGVNRGFAVLYEDGAKIMRQNFRESGDVARTNGKPKSLSSKQVAELEEEHGVDFNGDGVYGEESAEISSVLFAGDEGTWGRGLYELDDATVVASEAELEEGDTPSEVYQLVTSKGDDFAVDGDVLGAYGVNRGFAVLYEDGAKIMRQNFRESGDVARTNGKPKSLSSKQVAELEKEHGVDFNGDGVYGEESAEISSVLFAGDEGTWGRGLYELDDATVVASEAELEEGDTPSEAYQLVTSKGDDFAVDGDVLGAYGVNRGFAVLYEDGAKIMRQNFRESGDVARTNGKPKSLSSKQVAELEEDHGVDFNGDGVYGEESAEISSVLFAGAEGTWGRGLYELDDATVVASEAELEEGDTPSEAYQLVTSKGDDFAVDGDVLGAYGVNRGFAVLYEDGAKIMRQNFRESGDVARTNGKPESLSSKQVVELEEEHGVDFNGDGVYGEESAEISSVLFAGDEGTWGRGLYELDDATVVASEAELEEGDTPSEAYQLVTSKGDDFAVDGDVLGAYGVNRGFAVLYEDGAKIMRQNFRESGDVARTNGKPKSLSSKQVAELEEEHGVDFNGDGVYGEESAEISSVLFAGDEGTWGRGLYELDDATVVASEAELEEGDTPSEAYQLVTSKGDDFAVDGDVLGAYGVNRGFAVLYEDGAKIMRQNFRESGDVARTNGKPESLSSKQVVELEEEHGVDFNGDGVYGEESAEISSVLFAGDEGTWGRGLYELDDATFVASEAELEEGDTPSEAYQLVTSKGDDFAVDGDVLGAYGVNRGFAVLYEDGAKIMRQNFRESGDVARTNGKPKSLSSKQVAELEEEHGVDFNGDSLIGPELPLVETVLFDGLQGDWGQGIYDATNGSLMIGEKDLDKGDEIIDGVQLMSVGDVGYYEVDGGVVGAFGGSDSASIVFVQSGDYYSQSFGMSDSIAIASGPPELVSDRIFDLEDMHSIDFNGDESFGEVVG